MSHEDWLEGEKLFIEHIKSLPFARHKTALDIGANYGIYTKLLAQRFGDVVAFEPHPNNFRILTGNFYSCDEAEPILKRFICDSFLRDGNDQPQYGRIHYINKAVSDVVGIMPLYVEGRWHGLYTIVPNSSLLNEDFVNVESTTIDAFCSNMNPPVGLMKIDVEGGELLVLNGAYNTIDTFRPTILLEVHDINFDSLKQFFNTLNYRFYPDDVLVVGHHYIVSAT